MGKVSPSRYQAPPQQTAERLFCPAAPEGRTEVPQPAWRRGGDLLREARRAQPQDCPHGLAQHLSLGTTGAAPARPAQGCRLLVCRVRTAGQGAHPGTPGLPPQTDRDWGPQAAGGALGSCPRQRGPGQQCRSQAPGERPPPAHRCQSDAPRRREPSPEKAGQWGRNDPAALGPLSTAQLEKLWAQLEKARSEKRVLELPIRC